jgi:hypothetical protein
MTQSSQTVDVEYLLQSINLEIDQLNFHQLTQSRELAFKAMMEITKKTLLNFKELEPLQQEEFLNRLMYDYFTTRACFVLQKEMLSDLKELSASQT